MISTLLKRGQYDLVTDLIKPDPQTQQLLELGTAVRLGDLKTANTIIQKLPPDMLQRQTRNQQRVRFLYANMTHQLELHEYGHYLRAMTPLIVSSLRLLIERHIMPQLNEFIQPVVKPTQNGDEIYRGLRWNQARIEKSHNIIFQTWKKHYGNHFNYNHYISSSHLVKIINDHSRDKAMIEQVNTLRQYEKQLRNLAAHEVIYIDAAFIERRAQTDIETIHQLLFDLLHQANVEPHEDTTLLQTIHQHILTSTNRT